MPAQPLLGGLPPDLQLSAGYIIRVRLLSPTTGASVAGGVGSNVVIFVRNIGGGNVEDLETNQWRLVNGPNA